MKQIYYILFIGLFLLKTSGTYAQDLSGITIYVNPDMVDLIVMTGTFRLALMDRVM